MEKLQFYKDQYQGELVRKREIDQSITFPTTLTTVLISVAFYYYQTFQPNEASLILISILTLTIGLFGVSIGLSIFLLAKMFLNVF